MTPWMEQTQTLLTPYVCAHHEMRNLCACGMNATCPNCHFGYGATPCACTRSLYPIVPQNTSIIAPGVSVTVAC